MKLRNKKTGEIMDLECITIFDRPGRNGIGEAIDEFYNLAELNEEWEDYKPAEPLIKDAECRGIMRLWADRCGVKTVILLGSEFGSEFRSGGRSIGFGVDFGLEHRGLYTIDELCGEEE